MKELNEFRYENKFYIDNLNCKEIEHIIKHHPAIFKEIFYERKINNIYLDSVSFKNYHHNIAGNVERIKVRIRWYGETFGKIKNPVLEIKIKKNELGRKMKFKLKDFYLDRDFSYKKLQEVFKESNLPEWLEEKLKFSRPTLLNSYFRKYFISADKKYRITIDKDFIFYHPGNKGNFFSKKINFRDYYVLEMKYGAEDFKKASHITKHFPFRLSAHSKYVRGVERMFE